MFSLILALGLLNSVLGTAPVAGGAGEAAYFAWTRSDVISLHWEDLPSGPLTVECKCVALRRRCAAPTTSRL